MILGDIDTKIFKRVAAALLAATLFSLCVVALMPGKALATVNTYSDMVTQTTTLEKYANDYIAAHPGATDDNGVALDSTWLVPAYIRSVRYSVQPWPIIGGGVPADFITYCANQDAATGSDVQSLRTMGTITLPNGETTDAIHMFTALDVSVYKGIGSAMSDLAGWIGDTNDLLRDVSDATQNTDSASVDAAYSIAAAHFNTDGRFGPDDVRSDLDGINIATKRIASPTTSYGDILNSYFTAKLTDDIRVQTFCGSRMSSVPRYRDNYRSAVSSAYESNAYIAALEQIYGLTSQTNNRTGCCNVVADYLLGYMPVTISYTPVSNGTVSSASENVEAGNAIAQGSTAISDTGYHFVSWTSADSSVAGTSETFVPQKPATGFYEATAYSANFAANTYTISFDSNEGSGTMTSQDMTFGVQAALTSNSFTRTGYTFSGWNTASDGTGTTYADGASVESLTSEDNGAVTLYAQWTANLPTPANTTTNTTTTTATTSSSASPSSTLPNTADGSGAVMFIAMTLIVAGVVLLREVRRKTTR